MLPLASIDLEELAEALESAFFDYEGFWWIDPKTGEIGVWMEDAEEDPEGSEEELDERGVRRIDTITSREGYQDMESFVATVTDERARERLSIALEGSGAFRRFRNNVAKSEALETQWHNFHNQRMRQRAIEWLVDEDLVDPAEAAAALEASQ